MSQTLLEADELGEGLFIPNTVKEAERWVGERISQGRPFLIRGNSSSSSRDPYENSSLKTGKLSTRKLRKTLFFDPDDLVAGVEAGKTVSELQKLLAKKGMMLPVNPWYPGSTLGGMVSANICGPNRMDMGGLRDFLIGIEYINGTGERVHAGGKVVKNVTGYDLTRMMIGHLGGLGLITSVNFKAQPFPVEPHGIYLETKGTEWRETVEKLRHRRIPLDWIQAVSSKPKGNGFLLGLGFSGNTERRGRISSEINAAFGCTPFMLPDGEMSTVWPCLPGQSRFSGFLPAILEYWGMPQPGLHVLANLTTSSILELPLEKLKNWEPRMIVHPVGSDIHFFLKDTEAASQKMFLESLCGILNLPGANLRLVRTSEGCGPNVLGPFGKPPGYSITQGLKRHLDPQGIFHSPFYGME